MCAAKESKCVFPNKDWSGARGAVMDPYFENFKLFLTYWLMSSGQGELADVLPGSTLGGSEPPPAPPPLPPLHLAPSIHHQHLQQQQQQQQEVTPVSTHHHHPHPHQEHAHPRPSQHEQMSPHSHQQSLDLDHHHQQQQQQQHQHLDLDHQQQLQPSHTPRPHQLQSQGVNTGSVGVEVDVASSSQRSHVCSTCLKGFRSKQQLAQHSLVHSNIRKYTCTYCERSFKQLSHLQQHTRIHTGEKPYSCKFQGCERAFAQLSNLQHHMRNHDDQVKKEASRIHKCQVCHRSYTNESSLKAHTLKMHVHINKGPQEGQNPDGTQVKKRKKKKKNQLYNSPTMVPLTSSHDGRPGISIGKKMSSESSSDDDLIIMGESRKGDDDIGLGGMPRSLVESLNHYERTLAAGMIGGSMRSGSGGKKLQDSNITSTNQFGGVQGGGMGGNRFDPGRPGSLGLMGLQGMDPTLMSSQHPEMIERAAAAAAAAVSNQLHNLNHNPNSSSSNTGGMSGSHGQGQQSHGQMSAKSSGNSTESTGSITSRAPTSTPPIHPLDMVGMGGQYGSQNPYLSASHLMDAHLRSQLTPMSLPVVHEQYPAHTGPPLVGGLSQHARYLGPRGMLDLPMSYGQPLSSSQSILSSTATSSHQLTPPTIHHGGSRPPSVIGSPQHVPESLNFNS